MGAHPGNRITPAPGPAEDVSRQGRASFWRRLGPGLITGAADDDPSGIATYSQAGAQFGFGLLWTMPVTYPLMVAVQVICARIGRVSGNGLAANIRKHYPRPIIYGVVVLLLIANAINVGADISAMAASLHLMIDGPVKIYGLLFGLLSLGLQLFVPYQRYVHVLKWLTITLLAYVATAVVIDIPWAEVWNALLPPEPALGVDYLTACVAIVGTTISPYLFFWQASEEVEDMRAEPGAKPLQVAPRQARDNLRRIGIDTWAGMGLSNLVAFCIILTAAVTLHAQGITRVENTAQAASALRPVAGELASLLFSVGIVGTGLLALPVLAGAAAYAMAGAFQWRGSLAHKPLQAGRFYLTIAFVMAAGIVLSALSPLDPMRALYWSAVINGVIAVPLLALIMLMASRPDIMGRYRITPGWRCLGWTTTAAMSAAVAYMLWLLATGR